MYIVQMTDPMIYRLSTYPTVKQNLYEVSNYGVLRNRNTNIELTQFLDKKGYSRMVLMGHESKTVNVFVHRLVAWEFVPGYDSNDRNIVNHKTGDRACNWSENLEWVNVKENNIHGLMHGNIRYGAHGTLNHSNIHADNTVHKICKLLELGYMQMDIMNEFGYFRRRDNNSLYTLIDGVKRKEIWTSISSNYNI
jgi:HNH endonuclease